MNVNSQMTIFSYLAYLYNLRPNISNLETDFKNTVLSLKHELQFSDIVWGPVAHKQNNEILTDSLVYIVKNNSLSNSPEYTVVFRGTNPLSISSWIFQDLQVGNHVSWANQSPNTKIKNAFISQATDTSLGIHKSLTDNNISILQWLLNIINIDSPKHVKVNITGHSLGGLMSSTFALYLHDELESRNLLRFVDFYIYELAGPTAGNSVFADSVKRVFGKNLFCFVNSLDIANHVWDYSCMSNVMPTIYNPITLNEIEKAILSTLTWRVKNLDYQKLLNNVVIHSELCSSKWTSDYIVQAIYQHVWPYLNAISDDIKGWVEFEMTAKVILEILYYFIKDFRWMDKNGNTLLFSESDIQGILQNIEGIFQITYDKK